MNVPAMLKRFGKSYTVTRPIGDGSYSTSTGLFVPGSTTTLSVLGSIQPLSPEELLSIPEGDRSVERFRFYAASTAPLAIGDVAHLRKADRVSINGVPFEVESADHWSSYSKAIVARVNTDAN